VKNEPDESAVYMLTGAALKKLLKTTSEVKGMANHIDVGTETDGVAKLRYARMIQIVTIDAATGDLITAWVASPSDETGSGDSYLEAVEVILCVEGVDTPFQFYGRNLTTHPL
jgi:hypothetical protein